MFQKALKILRTSCFLGFFMVPVVGAVTFSPIAKVTALGGQFFTGQTHANGLNLDATFVPALGLTPKFYLIPIYMGTYKEVQSVYNFQGENIVITKQSDQSLALRTIWALHPQWRLKPRAGWKRSWLKQSTDESLRTGILNNYRVFTGLSAEHPLPHGSWEMGYEYGYTRYPNYQAIDAAQALTTTGLTTLIGTDILNYRSHNPSLAYTYETADKRFQATTNFDWIRQNFADQQVITKDDGGFENAVANKRVDDVFNLALQQTLRASPDWTFGAGETLQYNLSNQNAFDVTQSTATNSFTYRYYNFVDFQLTPSIIRRWKEGKWEMSLSGSFGYRRYSHRRTQDGSGQFQHAVVYQLNRGATLQGRYRIRKGLFVVLQSTVLTYSSNTRYEANNPYNYTTYNYLGGLSWEY